MDIKAKRKELLKMPDREFINRILAFPDREKLNRDEEGKRRKYPSAEMAVRARRSMEKDPEWKISDKQKWCMADSFATYSTDELKVAGIKYANVDPNTINKTPVLTEGVKTVYEMQYHLIPEPENEYDKNAVAVYVNNENDDGKTRIGYLPAAYTSIHPIVQPMTAKGTLTDHSNGHFKTISYTVDMDTEALDNKIFANMDPNKYTYRMPFILNGEVMQATAYNYLNTQRDWTQLLNEELECWGVNGQVDKVKFDFPSSKAGEIIVESSAKLNEEAMMVCGSYFRYSLESGISGDLKREGFVKVPQNLPAVNTRDRTYFSLQGEPSTQTEEDDFAKAVDGITNSNEQQL